MRSRCSTERKRCIGDRLGLGGQAEPATPRAVRLLGWRWWRSKHAAIEREVSAGKPVHVGRVRAPLTLVGRPIDNVAILEPEHVERPRAPLGSKLRSMVALATRITPVQVGQVLRRARSFRSRTTIRIPSASILGRFVRHEPERRLGQAGRQARMAIGRAGLERHVALKPSPAIDHARSVVAIRAPRQASDCSRRHMTIRDVMQSCIHTCAAAWMINPQRLTRLRKPEPPPLRVCLVPAAERSSLAPLRSRARALVLCLCRSLTGTCCCHSAAPRRTEARPW